MTTKAFFQASCLFLFSFSLQARSWENQAGKIIEADFISVHGDSVSIRADNGRKYTIKISTLSQTDQDFVAQRTQPMKKSIVPKLGSIIEDAMKGRTMRLKGEKLKKDSVGINPDAEYYAIYYSAHWCPPCRTFTPNLSTFYDEMKPKHDNFEVIFVSSDRTEYAMEEYMNWGKMNYPALDFDKIKNTNEITRYSSKGIPRLVLVDRKGEVLSDSYVGEKYVGPYVVLKELNQLITEK